VTIFHKNYNIKHIGRPSKGMCWIVKQYLVKSVVVERISNNFTTLTITQHNKPIKLIGCYMSSNNDNATYDIELATLEQVITNNMKNIILGDLNADIYISRTNHDKLMKKFLKRNNYTPADMLYAQNTNHTYMMEGLDHITSWIDHILIKEEESYDITQINILDKIDNKNRINHSDHKAVTMIT
jgi:hypothetical protein